MAILHYKMLFYSFVKGQLINILGFAGCTISVTATQLCLCSMKAATDHT